MAPYIFKTTISLKSYASAILVALKIFFGPMELILLPGPVLYHRPLRFTDRLLPFLYVAVCLMLGSHFSMCLILTGGTLGNQSNKQEI